MTFRAVCDTMGTVKENTNRKERKMKISKALKEKILKNGTFDTAKFRYVAEDENHIYRISKEKICTDGYFNNESWEEVK